MLLAPFPLIAETDISQDGSATDVIWRLMMFIQGNLLGFLMFIAGGVIAAVGSLLLKLPNAPVMIAIGMALTGMDLFLRTRERDKQGWLTQKQYGGYLYFMPVWIFGVVVIVVNIINASVKA